MRMPASWEEVTPSDLHSLARLSDRSVSRETMLVLLLLRMNGMTFIYNRQRGTGLQTEYRVRKGWRRYWLPVWVLQQYANQLSFLVDSVAALPFSPLKGVSPMLYGVAFEDYYAADAQLYRYQQTGRAACLRRAVYLLTGRRCRPRRVRGREMVIWWAGIRQMLQDRYPNVFSGDGSQAASPAETLLSVLEALNGFRPQDNGAILRADVHYVLSALNSKIECINKQKNAGH